MGNSYQEFLPTKHKGHILFTTRAQATGMIASNIQVEKLTSQDSVLLLLRLSKQLDSDTPLEQARVQDHAAAERTAKEMDGLPLALVQAGAYVEETGCRLEDYLDLYTTHRQDLLARLSPLMLDYSGTVATTWSLSFQRVKEQSPIAVNVLRLCAFLAPDAIPEELLRRAIVETEVELGSDASDS